ncbi:MAG: hypothetical protein ACLPVY_16325 [Acidimicrobiia bacterium]
MFNRRNERKPAAARAAGARYERLHRFLQDAQTFDGVDAADVPGMHSRIRDDERVFLCVQGASLIAPPTNADAQTPRPIDQGELVVTTARAVFTGTKQIRQWSWSQLVDIEHADRGPWTSIRVSDRPRTFGVLYDKDHQDEIRFNIELAVAIVQGKRNALIDLLSDELRATQVGAPEARDASMIV